MKKTLSVILAAVMMFTVVPFFAFAVGVTPLTQAGLEALEYSIPSYSEYIASEDLTIPAGTTLIIGSNANLIIPDGKTLDIFGNVSVKDEALLQIDGNISNADKISGEGSVVTKLSFPALDLYDLEGKIEVSFASSYSGSPYDDLVPQSLTYVPVDPDGEDVYVPINQYIYIIAHIIEPVEGLDKFDDSLLVVRLNGVAIPYKQGNHCTLLSTGGKISYSTWTNDDAYLSTYKIDLPVKDGCDVVGREGEMSADGEIVYIKYGKPFSFRVDVWEEYSKSPIEVYIVSGYGWTNMDTSTILADLSPAQPDENGYYTIPEVKSDYMVFVLGLVANEKIDKISSIFEQVKNIFEMIKKFFVQILEVFGISLGE